MNNKITKAKNKNISKRLNVIFFGTMSAGKSTFINALIGSELLPMGNEATTTIHTTIEHDARRKSSYASCYSDLFTCIARSENINSRVILDWSCKSEVKKINIKTRFKGGSDVARNWVLHDTPGPNNSQTSLHSERAFQALTSTSCDTLCYLLNATQIGINDDLHTLQKIQKILTSSHNIRIIFILNKIDCLDPDRGESVFDLLQKTKNYLKRNGFNNPFVIPVMGYLALTAKKQLCGEPLSLKERLFLRSNIEAPPDIGCDAPPIFSLCYKNKKYRFRANLKNFHPLTNLKNEVGILKKLIIISGISSVEDVLYKNS